MSEQPVLENFVGGEQVNAADARRVDLAGSADRGRRR
jgi:hypothetical protein